MKDQEYNFYVVYDTNGKVLNGRVQGKTAEHVIKRYARKGIEVTAKLADGFTGEPK